MLAKRQPKGGSKVNKYISAFSGGIIGTILGAIFAWFVVLDPNAPVYTFINSLPQSFQEPATNLFVFFGLIVCVCVGLYFIRLGYMSATKEGSAKLKIERAKERNNKVLDFIYKHSMRFLVGLLMFTLFILVYEIVIRLDEDVYFFATLFMWVILYALGYAVLRLWNLTWGPKVRAKLDEWGNKNEET